MFFLSCRRGLTALFALSVFLLGAVACSESAEVSAPTEPPASTPPPSEPSAPAPPPLKVVRIVDGDTQAPVAHVRVAPRGRPTVLARRGSARLDLPSRRVSVRVSAPGYAARMVRLDFHNRLIQRVELWRPALQWPNYGVNPARTQVSGMKVRPPFRVVWKRNLRGLLEFPASVWAGVAYVHTMGGSLRAISMKTGRVLWKKKEGSLMASSPAVDPVRGVLVSTSMAPGYVTVRSLETGRLKWRYPTGTAEPSPVVRDGIAYFATTGGDVYALDLDKRKPRWIFHGGVKITSSPALVGTRLFFGDYAGRVFALDSRNGRVAWQNSAGTRVYGTVAVSNGRVFAPSVSGGLSAFSVQNGRLLWRVQVGSYVYSSPAVFRGRVYFGAHSGAVYCVSASSGRMLWSRGAGGRVSGAVVVVDGVVYAGSVEGRISAWTWRHGRSLWTFGDGRYVPVSGSGERLLLHGFKTLYAVEHRRGR